MPRATLEFNLPEERSEFMTALHGGHYESCLCDIDNLCRQIVKHGQNSEETIKLAEQIRGLIPYYIFDNE